MGWEAWLTCATVVGVLVVLIRDWASADVALPAAVVLLVAAGELTDSQHLLTIEQAVAGLGNPGLATVGVLFVVVAGLTYTGAMRGLAQPLAGNTRSIRRQQVRLLLPVAGLSAVLNNTPVVAMFLPVVEELSKRTGTAASKLYLPMAYAATFGGVCTLIGTSTNLVVNGLWVEQGGPGFRMFDLAWVGVPCVVAGIGVLLWLSPTWLPDRKSAIAHRDNLNRYFAEVVVQADGPLVGKTVEEAKLRRLDGLFLVEIEREGELTAPVSPVERLCQGDRLAFVGAVGSIVELHRIRGLGSMSHPATSRGTPRRLIEAVVSHRCPLVGTTIRAGRFRARYDAAVVAIARGPERIRGRLGDVELHTGDTLLLEAGHDFLDRYRHSKDFYFVSGVDPSLSPRTHLAPIAAAILVAMILLAATGLCGLLTAACLAALAMVGVGCCTPSQARESIDWPLLVTIAASLAMGLAIQTSGLAESLSEQLIEVAGSSPWFALAAVYLVTTILTELVTNNAAAVLMYPLAVATADALGVEVAPYLIAIMVAASAGFATPFGYQTNLMVYGPGGYCFRDYVVLGIPLDLAFMVVAVAITPLVFPF